MLNDEHRGVDEAYQVAGSSSNLRVEAERRTDADVLIAAGLTRGILGTAAMRLRSEWDRRAKPRLGQDVAQEAIHMANDLKSFKTVAAALSLYMGPTNFEANRLIFWWLDQKCIPCGGTKFEVAKGTNRHTAKLCKSCGGAGTAHIPQGAMGRRAANYLDDCVQGARTSIGKRLRSTHPVA